MFLKVFSYLPSKFFKQSCTNSATHYTKVAVGITICGSFKGSTNNGIFRFFRTICIPNALAKVRWRFDKPAPTLLSRWFVNDPSLSTILFQYSPKLNARPRAYFYAGNIVICYNSNTSYST